jgi:hypothetical protein
LRPAQEPKRKDLPPPLKLQGKALSHWVNEDREGR